MRNSNNTVWSNVTAVKAEVEVPTKKVKRTKKMKVIELEAEKSDEPKEERGDKENEAKKLSKPKRIEKPPPNQRSASVTREPLAIKKMALKTGKSRAASES